MRYREKNEFLFLCINKLFINIEKAQSFRESEVLTNDSCVSFSRAITRNERGISQLKYRQTKRDLTVLYLLPMPLRLLSSWCYTWARFPLLFYRQTQPITTLLYVGITIAGIHISDPVSYCSIVNTFTVKQVILMIIEIRVSLYYWKVFEEVY